MPAAQGPEPAVDAAQPACRTLRDWLDRLAGTGRLAVARPDVSLRYQLAAIANRLDGSKASFFHKRAEEDLRIDAIFIVPKRLPRHLPDVWRG